MANTNELSNRTHSSINRVLNLGDSRKAGSILAGLASSGLEVHQAVHSNASTGDSHGVVVHETDFSPDAIKSLFARVKPDVIFSTASGGSYDYQKQLIDTAIECRAPRFIPAEFEQDTLNDKVQERLPPCKERARVIQYLEERSKAGKIEWVAIATGCALDQGLVSGNIGFDIKWQSVTVHGSGDECFAASSVPWIGKTALATVKHWEAVKNRYLYVPGMITTAHEVLATLEAETGQKWERGEVEVEQIVYEAEKRMERGFPDAGMFLMERSVLFDESLGAVKPFVEKDAKEVLGLEEESLGHLVEHVVHDHKHGHGKGSCGCD